MKIIVGLGNPGNNYSEHRHNVGFKVIEQLANLTNIKVESRRYQCCLGEGKIKGTEVILATPITFMNKSGDAIKLLVSKYHVESSDILIIYDDTNLKLGQIRIRKGGSSGGHNGIASIIEALDSEEFPRLRIGIGAPKPSQRLRDFVLSSFSIEEEEKINKAINLACEASIMIVQSSIDIAMNRYNQKR